MIRTILRLLLAAFYAVAGWFHLTSPAPFLRIMPSFVPAPEAVIMLTGLAEFAGAAALAQPWSRPLRRAGAVGGCGGAREAREGARARRRRATTRTSSPSG